LLATFAVYAGAALLAALVAAGRARGVLGVALLGLFVNLAGNTYLVPRRAIEGAALATFATEVAVALAAGAALHLRGHDLFSPRRKWIWLAPPFLFYAARALSELLPIPVPA
jgi:O-antigen/teichoic acid export membrane protein